MKNLILLNRLGFNPDLTTRQSRVDSVSNPCRCRVLATLLLCLTLFVGSGNVWGATATYSVTSTSAVSDSNAPTGSSSSYANTYTTNQQTTSGNTATLTLNSLGGVSISNITLSMRSNTSNGSGKLSYSTDGGTSWTYLVGSAGSGQTFANEAWNGSYTTSWVDISKDVSLSNVAQLKVRIEVTNKSLYCRSFSITYTAGGGTTYTVSYFDTGGEADHGDYSASSTSVSSGSAVTLTATPDAGYKLSSWSVYKEGDAGTTVTVTNNQFTMPTYNVVVKGTFESKGCTDHGASSITGGALSDADHGPLHAFYDYSTSQILYTKSDLDLAAGKKGTIKSIYFEYSGAAAMAARTIKIYMANTALTELTTGSYVPYASFTQVYSGTFSCGSAGWYEITLDTPFDYNGVGQLAVMIDDNTNKYESSKSFKYHSATGKQIYKRQDDTDIDPASWTPASAIDYRPNTKFCIQEADMTPATVTLMDNGATITETSAGAGVTLPSRTGCTGYKFEGWTKTWVAPQSSWITTAPTIIPAGSYTPTANENLYPVYTKTEGGGGPSNDYKRYSGSLTEGDYIIYYDGKALNTTVTSDRLQYEKVTPDDDVITTTVATIIWHIAPSSNYWTIYNADANKYAASTGAKNKAQMLADGTDDKSLWTVSGTSTYEFVNKQNTTNSVNANLRENDTYGFACYATSTGGALSLYKNVSGGSTTSYISVPNCCEPLAAVSGSVACTSGTTATLSWSAVAGAETYKVKVPGSSHNDWTTATSPVNVTGLTAGQIYTAYFQAFDSNGSHCTDGPESTTTFTTPKITLGAVSGASLYIHGEGSGSKQHFTVAGVGLTGNLTVTAPANFEVCATENGTYTSSITLTPSSGDVNSTVYFQLASGLAVGSYGSSDITVSGGSAASVNVAVSGTVSPACEAPTINTQPTGATYNLNATAAALSVSATKNGTGPALTYQWYSNTTDNNTTGTLISGETNSTYMPSTNAAGTTYYYCVVSSGACSVTSNTAAVTTSTPAITVSPASIAFGERAVDATTGYTETFTVSGSNLAKDQGLTLAVTGANAAMFTLSSNTVAMTEQGAVSSTEITVTYKPSTAGTHSATLTVSSTGAADRTVVLSGTAKWGVTWMLGTSEHATTLAANGTKPTLPSVPANNALGGCANTFVGWSATPALTGTGNTAPDDLFTSAAGAPDITANTTFRAVFATASGGGAAVNTVLWSEDFSGWNDGDTPSSSYITNSHTGTTVYGDNTLTYSCVNGGSNTKLYGGNQQIYAGGAKPELLVGKSTGSFTVSGIPSGGASVITISYKQNNKQLTVAASGTGYSGSKTETPASATTESFDVTVGSDATFTLTFTPSSDNVRIDDLEAKVKTGGATYSDYVTMCCNLKPVTGLKVSGTTANSVTLTWTAPSSTTGIDHLELRNASTNAKVGGDIVVGTTTVTVSELEECNSYSYYIASVGATCETVSETVAAQPFSGSKTVNYQYHDGTTADSQFTTDCDHQTITLPAPTWALHTFMGWYDAATGGSKAGDGGATYNPATSSVTLHAQWTETNFVLTQTIGSHTTAGNAAANIKTSDIASSDLVLTYSISDNGYALPKTVTVSGGGIATWELGTNYTWELSADKHSATLTIKQGQTIAADVTVTVAEQARYTVTLNEHGSTTTQYYAADDNLFTWGDIDGCGAKLFYGWTTDGSWTTSADESGLPASCVRTKLTETINSTRTYYAIYADAVVPQNPGYVKVTTISAGTYLIAGTDNGTSKAYAGQNGTGNTATGSVADVTISNDVISTKGSAVEVTVSFGTGDDAGYFAIQTGNTYMVGSSGNYLVVQNDIIYDWSLTNDGRIHSKSQDTRYIELRSGTPDRICTYAGTQNACYLFKKQTTAWSNFTKTCALYDIAIDGGITGGTVTTSPAAGSDAAGEGQTVTVNVTPDACKYLSALEYNDGSDDYAISIASAPYTFTMPAADITITATFGDRTVSSITPATSTHRAFLQNGTFTGEQITVTYSNGDTELLEPNNGSLAFSGYNMSTSGNQTVHVVLTTSCGNASCDYSIDVMDGVPVTYVDAGEETTVKYDVDATVPVESRAGRFALTCDGWEFAGWSETEVADNSTTFTPVYNFSATTPKTLYAVYSKVGSTWLSAYDISEMRSGAKYVIVKNYSSSNHYALVNTPDAEAENYLDGTKLATDCDDVTDDGNKTRYQLMVTPTASMIWVVKKKNNKWAIYNPAADKYLKITSDGYTQLTTACEDTFTLTNGDNDSEIDAESTNASGKHLAWHNSSPRYWNGYGSAAASVYWMTNNEQFSSNPPCAPRSVIFHGNGGTVSYGENESSDLVITEANRGDGITTPTAAVDMADCNGNVWEFIGWLPAALAKTQIPVLTTDLLNDGGGNKAHTITADNEEYYAVYSNTGMPETKYGTITFTKDNIGQNYVNSEQTTIMSVTSMGDYTFGYVDLGHQSSIGMQFESGLGELYNKTSLGKINSISFTNFTAGGISNLRVYVGDEEKATTHLLEAEEMQHIDGSNTWTYYPSDKYSYLYIKDNSGYVNVQSISIDFGKGSVVYASVPDCTLRVTYKAAGEEDHIVEIGDGDSHDLPAYYPASGCGDKEFIGWAEAGISALQQTAPTIYTADGSLTDVSAPKTLYAVYASRNGGKVTGTHTLTEDFESYTANANYGNTGLTFNNANGLSWVIDYGNVTGTTASTFGGSNSKHVILYPNAAQGSGINNVLKMSSGVNDVIGVSLYAFKNAGPITGKLYWSGNGTSWTEENSVSLLLLTNNNPYQTSKTFNTVQQALWIKITASEPSLNNGHYLYLNDIVFTIADRAYYYTDYSTTCETASAPVTLTWAGTEGGTIESGTEPATSALGNWLTLPTLSKGNYRFDGWKVTIDGDEKTDVYAAGEQFLVNHPVTFTAQWTQVFEVSAPVGGVTSYKDITTTSGTFSVTVKGSHSITPVVDNLSDDTHFAVTITTPGTNDGDDTDFNCTFTYTPDDFGTSSGAATHTATFRFKDEASGVVSEQVTIRGRSLPEEFVIAVKNNDKWYALPGDLQSTSAQPAIVPVEIMVNDQTTPTEALLAPQTALYKAAARYQNDHKTSIRFTVTGSNWLQVSGVEGTYNMWLSATGGTNVQDWQLYSEDFNAYELTIPSHDYPTKKMGIYNGSYIGYHTSPSNSRIYLLPVDAKYTPRDAKVKEWGRYAVVVEVATTGIATVKAHIDNNAPTSALTPQPVNVATIAGAKNLMVNTAGAIDFSAQEGHSLYLDWYDSSDALIATSQISVPLIIAEDKTMSSIDAVKTHWEKKEVHVLPGVKLTADAGSYASGSLTLKTVEVYPNAILNITTGTLHVTDLNLHCGWTRANAKDYDVARVHITPSAALTKTHAAMYYDIFDGEEGNHYYPLAVPFDVPVSTIDYADNYLAGFSTYGTHYVIKTYDGASRAENGVIDENWTVVAADGTLQAGRGYIMTAVAVKGDAVIRVPLPFDNAWTSDGEKASVDEVAKNVVPVVAHTGAASAGGNANSRRHAGWNMLGVPFMSCYTAGTDMYAADALIKGEIVIVGGAEGYAYENTAVPYVSVPAHNFAEYIQTDITEAKLLPGWSFFVQVGTAGNLTFSAAKQREDSDTPIYAPKRDNEGQQVVRTAIVLAGNGKTDKTTLIISDRYDAASYEIGADLEKMFGNGYTLTTYTLMEDGTRLVFNALGTGDIAKSIPVGFRAPEAGEYTFRLDGNYPAEQFERIELTDYKQGILTNLLEDEYKFTSDRTQDDTRFALNVVLRRGPEVPTATDKAGDNDSLAEKRIVDGCLVIIRDGRIYDATGKLQVKTAE